MEKAKGVEKWACGCALDHDQEVIDPCKLHTGIILAKIAEDNGGKIEFFHPE